MAEGGLPIESQDRSSEIPEPQVSKSKEPNIALKVFRRVNEFVGRPFEGSDPIVSPENINETTMPQRMLQSGDDRLMRDFSIDMQLGWLGYLKEPVRGTEDHRKWLLARQNVRLTNTRLIRLGIMSEFEKEHPDGEIETRFKIDNPDEFRKISQARRSTT